MNKFSTPIHKDVFSYCLADHAFSLAISMENVHYAESKIFEFSCSDFNSTQFKAQMQPVTLEIVQFIFKLHRTILGKGDLDTYIVFALQYFSISSSNNKNCLKGPNCNAITLFS